MAKLLRYQFRRLFKNKSLYICTAVSIAIIFLTALATRALTTFLEGSGAPAEVNVGGFVSLKSGMSAGMFTFLAAIMVAIFVSEDYTQETIKNIYGKGYSRGQVYLANYIVSLVEVVILFLAECLIGFAAGSALLGGVGSMGENYILSLLGVLLVVIAYHAIFFGVSISIRKSGGAVALSIIVPVIFDALFMLLDNFLLSKVENFKLSKR